MNKVLYLLTLEMVAFIISYYPVTGQSIAQVKKQIKESLITYENGKYKIVGDIICVDSMQYQERVAFQKITDPYRTLHECYIFITKLKSGSVGKFSVGIFKNNAILWMSDLLKGDYSFGKVESVFDINKDEFVEIVLSFNLRTYEANSEMWIFSWDGTKGWIINDVDSTGSTVMDTYFIPEDVDGNGIYEFVGESSAFDKAGNYTEQKKYLIVWNGNKYVVGPDLMEKKMTVANNLSVSLRINVVKLLDTLRYNYILTNSSSSMQSVKYLYISDSVQNVSGIMPLGWKYGHRLSPSLSCFISIGDNALSPGLVIDSLYIKTKGLPRISNYYAQAQFSPINYSLSDTSILMKMILDNIYTNSYIGKTIGPDDPPSPLVPLNFLDTLSSYTTQSRTIGWIKDQTTSDKYLGNFSSAKTNLQQNNITSARATLNQVLQDANIDSTNNITSEAYALIRYNTEYLLAQLTTAPISGCNIKLVNSTGSKLTGGTLQYYDGSWKDATNNNDGTFFVNTTKTSLSLRMTYEYGSLTKSNVATGPDTVVFQTVNAQVQLKNSGGSSIDTGTVQYYAGAWRSLGTTTSGIAAKELLPNTYSFRMTYAYASKDKQQDIGINPIVMFQTVNSAVQLQNSLGTLIDQGTVQYYSGAWRSFGTTSNGVANKELLPNNYSFRMTYAYASKDKQQDLSTNPIVVFQTVNAAVQLQNSQGSLIDQGTVQYYSGAWRDFGTTSNGVANKELLTNNYSFRMTYAYASKDKQQDLNTNPTVIFQTVNTAVQLKNSQGSLIDQGTVQYYSGAWRSFGTTTNGIANKELLPNNYSFRMTYEYASIDKQQDLSVNSTVDFATVLCTIRVKDSANQPINGATTSYYSGAWRQIGNTVNGEITKELLPLNLSFRAKLGTKQQDKQQNLSTNNIVEFILP